MSGVCDLWEIDCIRCEIDEDGFSSSVSCIKVERWLAFLRIMRERVEKRE